MNLKIDSFAVYLGLPALCPDCADVGSCGVAGAAGVAGLAGAGAACPLGAP